MKIIVFFICLFFPFVSYAQFSTEYVDLELPSGLLWATCNLGANSPTELGSNYSFAETMSKEDFSKKNYKYYKESTKTDEDGNTIIISGYTKYVTSKNPGYDGYIDNKRILDPEDDAAYVNLGKEWHIPTYSEWMELKMNSDIYYDVIKDNVNVVKIVSRNNGKYILIPREDYWTYFGGAWFWTPEIYNVGTQVIVFAKDDIRQLTEDRNKGYRIRPVHNPIDTPIQDISIDYQSIDLDPYGKKQLYATIKPINATNKEIEWTSSDENVAIVDYKGLVSWNGPGECVITVKTKDGSGKYATCSVSSATGIETICNENTPIRAIAIDGKPINVGGKGITIINENGLSKVVFVK